MTLDEAIETLLAMARVQDGYAKKAIDQGLRLVHKANAKAQREVAETLKTVASERDAISEANHRQANCLHLTAQVLGPDYSATVDALPKAARHVVADRAALSAKLAVVEAQVEKLLAAQVDQDVALEAAEARVAELEAIIAAYQDGTLPDLTAVYLAGGLDRRDEVRELKAEVERLRGFIDDFATAEIKALPMPHVKHPADAPDPVVDATEVWAWQDDAKSLVKGDRHEP